MKNLLFALVAVTLLMSCKSTGGTGFSDVTGKEWKLIEVRISDTFNREILFDRKALSRENAGNVFTIRFDNDNLSGTAAPNRYSAPFSLGETSNSISVNPIRTTMMAALWQPERLRESEYYQYLQNIYRWELINGRLVLSSKSEDGREIRMTYE